MPLPARVYVLVPPFSEALGALHDVIQNEYMNSENSISGPGVG